MGGKVSKSTFQTEQAKITSIFEDAVSTNTGTAYGDARNEIEAIINTYTDMEVPTSDYPEGLQRVVSLFPIVSGVTQKHVTIQILYDDGVVGNPDIQCIFHMSLVPGPNNEAITLIPHQHAYNEEAVDGQKFDNANLNTLSAMTRKPCKPKPCKPRPCKPCKPKKCHTQYDECDDYCYECCDYHH